MLGYCTNVHSGDTFSDVLATIQNIYKPICNEGKHNACVGLWLSNTASIETNSAQLKDTLEACNVRVSTMNGFPYSNFHSKVVQHNVYTPNWADPKRFEYTKRLATIFSDITNETDVGISTLPLGWESDSFTNQDAAVFLQGCVQFLFELEQQTGVCVHIDIETEPGCRLQRAEDLACFMNTYFKDDELARRHIRVCHDTCHGAVMQENVENMVTQYNSAGLTIGKVQLSNALEVNFDTGNVEEKSQALQSMIEPRYLHQTTIQHDGAISFHENLTKEMFASPQGLWRVHFHVPIHLASFGVLGTTQDSLERAIPILTQAGATNWEVETYTWDVLPTQFREGELLTSIAKELEWAASRINT
tara:strand:+ start:1204 stop:2286 length:1083 start_codon:yes stop_codon:yes gene_type:complete